MSGFYYKQKETSPYIPLKIRMFEWLLLKIAQQTKTCSKLRTNNTLELFQLMLFGSLLIILEHVFTSATESVFNLIGSVKSLFLISSCDEVSFSKVSITINGSNGVCNRACFNCHVFITWL